MARRTVNRKELREQAEAAESAEKAAPKKKVAKKTAKKAPRKSRAKKKAPEDIQMKLFWGVFNQTMKRIALYEYSQKKQAQEKAEQLTASSKSPHFVQKVKEEVVTE